MNKRVPHRDSLAVHNIHAIGVITPLSKHVDSINFHVKAMEEVYAPARRVRKANPFNLDIFTIKKFDIPNCIRLITIFRKTFFSAIIKNAVSVYVNIFRIFGENATVNKGILIKINTIILSY